MLCVLMFVVWCQSSEIRRPQGTSLTPEGRAWSRRRNQTLRIWTVERTRTSTPTQNRTCRRSRALVGTVVVGHCPACSPTPSSLPSAATPRRLARPVDRRRPGSGCCLGCYTNSSLRPVPSITTRACPRGATPSRRSRPVSTANSSMDRHRGWRVPTSTRHPPTTTTTTISNLTMTSVDYNSDDEGDNQIRSTLSASWNDVHPKTFQRIRMGQMYGDANTSPVWAQWQDAYLRTYLLTHVNGKEGRWRNTCSAITIVTY